MPIPPGFAPRRPQPSSGLFDFLNNKGHKQPVKPTGRHAVALGPKQLNPTRSSHDRKVVAIVVGKGTTTKGDVGKTAKPHDFGNSNSRISFDSGNVSLDSKKFWIVFTNTPSKTLLDRTGDAVGSHGLFTGYFTDTIARAARLAKYRPSVPFGRIPFAFYKIPMISKNTALGLDIAARGALPLFVLYTAADILSDDKITAGDVFEGVIVYAQIACPYFGLGYGVVDLGTSLITGTSLTSRIKSGIDSQITTNISF